MKSYLVAIALCLAVVMPAIAQTPEEIIRQTYAKGIFSNQVGLIERNVRLGAPAKSDDSLQATLQQNQLKFTLSDFKTGDITGNNNPLISIGSDSTGKQVLYMTLSYSSYTSEDSPGVKIEGRSLQVGWMPGPSNPATPAALKTLPISLIARDGGWTKYVTYHVVAEFQGKALEYQAFFVFDGNGKASARDPFVQNNGLDDLITASVYPMMLLRTPYRENPNVLKWLKANQLSTPSCQSGEVCCDTTTMKCGILPSDLRDELERKPVGSE
jgi:hypothetical protein